MTEDEWPEHFPGAWQNIPLEIRRFLVERLLEQQMQVRGGAAGLIESLYRGEDRTPARVSYVARAEECWPFVLADARRWRAQRESRKSPSPTEAQS